jgi:hypothetical protein
MAQMFEGAEAKSRQFPEHYERFAEQQGAEFFEASRVIVSSDVGGVHLDPDEHRKLGEAVAERIRACANRRVVYVSRGSKKAVQSL